MVSWTTVTWSSTRPGRGRLGTSAVSWTLGGFTSPSNILPLYRFDPVAVTEHEKRTAIMLAAENGHEEVFSMIAPLMKDLVVLKESTEALNRSRVDRLFHMMFSREDDDSLIEKFRSLVATVPVELVR